MSLSNWDEVELAERPVEEAPPSLVIPNKAGTKGERLLIVQVVVNFLKGKLRGAVYGGASGSLHRFEVSRAVEMVKPLPKDAKAAVARAWHDLEAVRGEFPMAGEVRSEWIERGEADLAYRRRIEARAEDTDFRPPQRVSLVLRRAGEGAMDQETRKAWREAIGEIEDGLKWAMRAATARKNVQAALLMVVEVIDAEWRTDPNGKPFIEAHISGIRRAEAVKLVTEELVRATWAESDASDAEALARAEYEAETGQPVSDEEWAELRVDLGFADPQARPVAKPVRETDLDDAAGTTSLRIR